MRLEAMFGATKTEEEAYYYAWVELSSLEEKANEIFANYRPKAE